MKRKISELLLIGMMIGAMLVAVYAIVLGLRDRERKLLRIEEERSAAQTKFKSDIEIAKRATAYPCAWLFYEVVIPPANIDDSPRLIMMGNEITSIKSPLDSSTYQLRAKGSHIELWTNFVAADRQSEISAPTWRKIGEKYSPDSQQCLSIPKGHARDSNR